MGALGPMIMAEDTTASPRPENEPLGDQVDRLARYLMKHHGDHPAWGKPPSVGACDMAIRILKDPSAEG